MQNISKLTLAENIKRKYPVFAKIYKLKNIGSIIKVGVTRDKRRKKQELSTPAFLCCNMDLSCYFFILNFTLGEKTLFTL